jgi:serine protease Do
LPIDVTTTDDSKDIGTCFVIAANRLLTARHCVDGKKNIQISDPMSQIVNPSAIWVPSDESDIALIEMNYYNYSSIPHFQIEYGNVLDEVLTMGYPPIPGFNAINISDMSHIGAEIKVSQGRIVAEERTLFETDAFFLINAKVKGGNSGGPIINNLGYAIGMIVKMPMDPDNEEKLDHLGYGVAVTGKRLKDFISNVERNNEKVMRLPFTNTKEGFSTM